MPKHPNRSKEACNKEVQQVVEQERVKKTFNTPSDEVYSVISDNLETIDSLYYEDNMKKEELGKFVNRQIEIKIFGGKKIAGKFVEIVNDEANSEWAIINDAIIDGKPYDITKTSITDIVSIVDTNRTLTPDSDEDNRTSVERRSSATNPDPCLELQGLQLRHEVVRPKNRLWPAPKARQICGVSDPLQGTVPALRAALTLPSSSPAAKRSQ